MYEFDHEELIFRYLESTADEEEQLFLFNWISASDAHKKEFLKLKELWTICAVTSAQQLPAPMLKKELGKLRLQIKKEKRYVRKFSRPIYREILKAACIAAVAIGGTFFFMKDYKHTGQSVDTSTSNIFEIAVEQGAQPKLYLADGTVVWLNARSKLSYPNIFIGSTREVTLEGEAYFEVAHNPEKPFVVKTSKFEVIAHGTSFNVSSYADDDVFRTLLVEGSVEVKTITNQNTLFLAANQMISISKADYQSQLQSNVDVALYTCWKEGLFRFHALPFAEIAKQLERKFEINFVYVNESIKQKVYTGTFLNYQSLDEILSIINRSTPFTYFINNGTVTIY